MANISQLRLKDRLFMMAYRYRKAEWQPGTPLRKPLRECRVAVATTAAFYVPGQTPFDEAFRGGDFSFRVIPNDVDLQSLRLGHRSGSFDPSGVLADKNLALPLDRLRELQQEGVIGSVNHRHFSFMGSITAPGRLVQITAPECARLLAEDGVDVVLLTPV